MDEREFESWVERLMQLDLSAGTEAFRDALLERCLAALCLDDSVAVIDDAELDRLAAAGGVFVFDPSQED